MSPCHQVYRRYASVALVLAVVLIALPAVLNAQTAPAPKTSTASADSFPTAEVFIGYQWMNPGGNVPGGSDSGVKMPSLSKGFTASATYNFTKWLGLEGNYGGSSDATHASINTLTVGAKLTWRSEDVNFFAHGLIGDERANYSGAAGGWGGVAIVGGGMDLKLWKFVSLRLFEADFARSQVKDSDYKSAVLRTGLVFTSGGEAPEVAVAAACSVTPSEVLVGEPLHAMVTASNFNPKHTLKYEWASTIGKIEGKDTGASIDTNGANAGNYTVTATVTDSKAKKNNVASCSSNFTVKPLNPPQISCSARPSMVEVGGSSTISCTCTSPDNVPVSVGGWTASGGNVSGSGSSAVLSTSGASPGTVTVTATCTDSRHLTASANASVTVNAPPPPPPPPPPQATKLNECAYPNVVKPWRVDNTCKQALEDVAHALQQDAEAKLVVVGNADPKEKRKNLAGERAVDVKFFLVAGEAQFNIDPSRIECRTGNAGTATSEQWILKAGATFPEAGSTMPVDEKKVKAIPDHPKAAAKKAAKKAQ